MSLLAVEYREISSYADYCFAEYFAVAFNSFSGSIPSELASLTKLGKINVG